MERYADIAPAALIKIVYIIFVFVLMECTYIVGAHTEQAS